MAGSEEMEVLLNGPLAVQEERKVDFFAGDLSKEHMLESARAEMCQMKQENKRLKSVLSQITKDYESLQAQFAAISRRRMGSNHHNEETATAIAAGDDAMAGEDNDAELLSLRLGTTKNTIRIANAGNESKDGEKRSNDRSSGELSLGLQCSSKLEGSASSDRTFDDDQMGKEEEEAGGDRQRSPTPSKASTKNPRVEDREISPQVQVKKARVSVRTRCDAPTMNDGCQWRKYGQKISKGNPCPRAYYRCTVAPSCPVRKQVQRCYEDMSILITTYEGTHNHPLPLAATNMASTTSAAASMLLSQSSSSSPLNTTSLNFAFSQSSKQLMPFHHLSAAPSHPPTITLDLTSPSPHFNTGALNFSPYPSLASGFFNKYTNEFFNSSNNNNRMTNATSYLTKDPAPQQDALTDTLAKAITSDPGFKSALAAAISSIVSNEGSREAQVVPPTMANGISFNSNNPSSILSREKLGHLHSSSTLGFLNSKASFDKDNLNL